MAPTSVRSVDVATAGHAGKTTATASSIAELNTTVPQTWRSTCGPLLLGVYRVATKLCTVQNTIAQYERHVADGSFPPPVRSSVKEPTLQFSKEFLGTPAGVAVKSALTENTKAARLKLLQLCLAKKREEMQALQEATAFDLEAWQRVVLETAVRAASTFGATVVYDKAQAEEDLPPKWSDGVPEAIVKDCKMLWDNGDTWHYRAVAIARSISDRTLVDRTKVRQAKTDTDIQMRDAPVERPVLDIMDERLNGKLKAMETRLLQTIRESPGKRRGSQLIDNRIRKQARQTREAQATQCRLEPLSRQEGPKEQGQRQESRRTTTVAAFLAECSKDFRPWLGDTYPMWYGGLSPYSRIKIGFALMRTWEVDTIRTATPGVFKHPDVSLPEDIEYSLAVNHKFILHQTPKPLDIEAAKLRFSRTVRNRWFFRDKEDKEFIPKFHVASETWEPPEATGLIEQGITAAMEVIDSQVSRALLAIATRPAARKRQNWAEVRDFIKKEKFLVKLTDKNLGLAVFPASWYDTNILGMLANADYQHVASAPTVALFEELMQTLLPKWNLPRQMIKYIEKRTRMVVPEFHAIPKVHKTPWTLRPIVPSHSWVTSSSSTVLDHLLQPILKQLPWVLTSSKDVIQALEKVRSITNEQVWIITGDVTAFYTNIPTKRCSKVIAGAWKRFQSSSNITMKTISQMVNFVMDNNFFRYRGQTFKQVQGLAMGTACAPVVANLYAAYFELKAKIVHQEGVLFYGRYIDDILCLFQGTREEALAFTHKLNLGGLEVRWSISSKRQEFLDIELILERDGLRVVHTRLYRKPMNRHLYIPWSSAHPLHVKKGFVKAELTRLAIICSKHEYFTDARREFYGNLRRRGYPSETLDEWLHQVQYDNRPALLLDKVEGEDFAPLMLSGHYNPVWDFVEVKEVISAARLFWNREELPDSLQEPLIRSLGRTTSLFDLMSVWNKTTLLDIASDGPSLVLRMSQPSVERRT